MKKSECNKQCNVITGVMIFITYIGIFLGLVVGRMMGISESKIESPELQEIRQILEHQQCELITYEQCKTEPLTCTIDSRSPTGFVCRPE